MNDDTESMQKSRNTGEVGRFSTRWMLVGLVLFVGSIGSLLAAFAVLSTMNPDSNSASTKLEFAAVLVLVGTAATLFVFAIRFAFGHPGRVTSTRLGSARGNL